MHHHLEEPRSRFARRASCRPAGLRPPAFGACGCPPVGAGSSRPAGSRERSPATLAAFRTLTRTQRPRPAERQLQSPTTGSGNAGIEARETAGRCGTVTPLVLRSAPLNGCQRAGSTRRPACTPRRDRRRSGAHAAGRRGSPRTGPERERSEACAAGYRFAFPIVKLPRARVGPSECWWANPARRAHRQDSEPERAFPGCRVVPAGESARPAAPGAAPGADAPRRGSSPAPVANGRAGSAPQEVMKPLLCYARTTRSYFSMCTR